TDRQPRLGDVGADHASPGPLEPRATADPRPRHPRRNRELAGPSDPPDAERTDCRRDAERLSRMALPEMALFVVVVGIALAGLLLAARPLLARLAARNIRGRTTRVVIVILGLLVGTAVISSSLVVGDTLSYIFLEDVSVRLGAIVEIVSNEFC